jgi:2-haloacid dehalogenase
MMGRASAGVKAAPAAPGIDATMPGARAGAEREDRVGWVTFDCFGTLVDWRAGFASILTPLVGERTAEVMRAYDRLEPGLEAETPHRRYADVLATGLARAAAECGIVLSEAQARRLPERWGTMAVFPDVEAMLATLRARGHRLAVLTNCDEDLFGETGRAFRAPFDLVVTAERVRDYKPAPAHFRYFSRVSGAKAGEWVHVANSWFHDIAPARALGVPRIWLDRDDTGEDPAEASARVRSADGVADAVAGLLPS